MRDEPPAALVELLARLHLATREQVLGVQGRARKLARDLPLFDSVWIDALAQARLLTPFQAIQINAGRGESLLVGPYVLRRRLQSTQCYLAAEAGSGEKSAEKSAQCVQLIVVRGKEGGQETSLAEQAAAHLQLTIDRLQENQPKGMTVLQAAGHDGGTVWAAYEPPTGFPVDEWLPRHGRLPPGAALEIARQMIAALAALETSGVVHGGIAASTLWIASDGRAQLTGCGVHNALSGNKLTAADDMLACGLLWWQLLAGRPPIVGSHDQTLARASSHQGASRAVVSNIRRIAPDVAEAFAAVIDRCTQRDRAERPNSFVELAELLGPPSAAGRRQVVAEILDSGRPTDRVPLLQRTQSAVKNSAQPLLAAAACAVLLAAATYPLWRTRKPAHEAADVNVVAGHGVTQPSEVGRGEVKVKTGSTSQLASFMPTLADKGERDHGVRPANFETTENDSARAGKSAALSAMPPVLELSGATEIASGKLHLQAGQIVRGKDGARPRIVMPPNGLAVLADKVRFENVDFVWRPRAEEITSPDRHALIDLQAGHAEFVGCTFQAQAVGSFELPVAVRMSDKLGHGAPLAPSVGVQLDRCVLQGVASGVECRANGPAAIELHNTLYLGAGPLVRFPNGRRADTPTAVTLEHVTVRGAAAMMELHGEDFAEASGTVTLTTAACVLAPQDGGALVIFDGRHWPKSAGGTLAVLDWNGQDSLVSASIATVIWRHDAVQEPLPDDALPVDGLVNSPFDFVGAANADPANSRLRHWLAPGRTELPPGIGEGLPRLPD